MRTIVRKPRVLDASRNEVRRLDPTALSVTLALEDTSHATMTLPEKTASLAMHTMVEVYTQHGSAGIFRVISINQELGNGITYELKHMVDVLSDSIFDGEQEFSGTPTEYIQAVLAKQKSAYWQLGTCACTTTYKDKIKYTKLYDLLNKLRDKEKDYYFSYDFSTWPWTINFLAKPSNVRSEFRLSRNVEDGRISWDDGDLCTRLYLSITNESGDSSSTTYRTFDDATLQSRWGIVEKTAGITTTDWPDADAYAARFFREHGNPFVQIDISGYELYKLSGDMFDMFDLGQLCRVNFASRGITLDERIIVVTYPDVLDTPDRVTIDLANKPFSAAGSLASLSQTQQDMADEAAETEEKLEKTAEDLEDTKTKVQKNTVDLHAQDTILTEQGELLRAAGIELDPSGIFMFAKREGALGSEMASIDVRADQITSKVEKNREDADKGFSEIKQRADRIDMDVVNLSQNTASHFEITDNAISANSENINLNAQNIRANALNIATNAGRIDTNAGMISNHATLIQNNAFAIQTNATAIQTNADLIETNANNIQVNAGSISVNAKNIKVIADDYVTINKLNTEINKMTAGFASSIRTTSLTATSAESNHLTVSGSASVGSLSVGNTGYANHTFSIDGKVVSNFLGTADVNFSRAAAVQEGVNSVTLSSSGWESGGRCIVKASNGKTYTVSMPGGFSYTGGTTWDSSHKTTVQFTSRYVGQPLVTATIDASSQYSAGQRAGSAAVTIASADIEDTGSRTWKSDKTGVYVGVRATASNGKTNTNSILVDTTTSYNQGKNDVTLTVNGNGSMIQGTNVTVNFKATASNGKSATGSSTVSVDSLCQAYRSMGRADYWNGHWERPSAMNNWTAVIPGETSGTTSWFTMRDVLPDAEISIRNPAQGYIVADVTICGKYYSKTIQISQ